MRLTSRPRRPSDGASTFEYMIMVALGTLATLTLVLIYVAG